MKDGDRLHFRDGLVLIVRHHEFGQGDDEPGEVAWRAYDELAVEHRDLSGGLSRLLEPIVRHVGEREAVVSEALRLLEPCLSVAGSNVTWKPYGGRSVGRQYDLHAAFAVPEEDLRRVLLFAARRRGASDLPARLDAAWKDLAR